MSDELVLIIAVDNDQMMVLPFQYTEMVIQELRDQGALTEHLTQGLTVVNMIGNGAYIYDAYHNGWLPAIREALDYMFPGEGRSPVSVFVNAGNREGDL